MTEGIISPPVAPPGQTSLPSFAAAPKIPLLNMAGIFFALYPFLMMPLTLIGGGARLVQNSQRFQGHARLTHVAGAVANAANTPLKPFGEMSGASRVCNFAKNTLHCDISAMNAAGAVSLGMSAVTTISLVKGFSEKVTILKHMYKEVTGRDISTWTLLSSKNLPEPLKVLRGQALHKEGFAGLLELGLTGLSIAMTFGKQPAFMDRVSNSSIMNRGMLANPFVRAMGMNMGMGLLYQVPGRIAAAKYDAISAYKAAYQAMAAQQPIPADVYMHMVAASGIHEDYRRQLVQEFSQAAATPGDVMRRLNEIATQSQAKPIVGPHTARAVASKNVAPQLSYSPT